MANVYVAGSSAQLDRVKSVMVQLRALGHKVTHDWPSLVEAVGTANPPDAELNQRRAWATEDLDGVYEADVLWLLMPANEPSFGAGVEFGYALARGLPIVVSGCHSASIFTALAVCYDRDDQALATEFTKETA